ncbi:MAG: hypothetical protein WBL65_10795, partial [Bryobacteraceae bacterium]
HQLPGFRATPAAPNFYYRYLLVHPSTASRMAAREQMGCSNAYTKWISLYRYDQYERRSPPPSNVPQRVSFATLPGARGSGSSSVAKVCLKTGGKIRPLVRALTRLASQDSVSK